MTPEYCVRMYHPSFVATLERRYYEVAKFEGSKEPSKVYLTTSDGQCTCPAQGDCKHVELVREFKRLNEPWLTVFWQAEGKWQWYEVLHEEGTKTYEDYKRQMAGRRRKKARK